jgi:hypothetical protein
VLSLDGRFATFTLFSNENSEQRDAGAQAGNVTGQTPEANAPQASPPQPSQSPTPRRHRRQ